MNAAAAPQARVIHHGRCFDGAVSAALAVRLLQQHEGLEHVETCGLAHRRGTPYDDQSFRRPVNVIVDFRYSAHPTVTWWFDHHESTFLSPADRAHFEADESGRKVFDPRAPSCAGLIHREVRRRIGLDLAPEDAGIVGWADVVDTARFPDAATAVRLDEPALQLTTWLEGAASEADEQRFVAELVRGATLEDLAAAPWIRRRLEPALGEHQRTVELVASRMRVTGPVAQIDLSDVELMSASKFIPYHLDPEVVYVVMVLRLPGRTKVSVGANPWLPARRTVDIGALCATHGGGGHPMVGAVTLRPGELQKAREIAQLAFQRLLSATTG